MTGKKVALETVFEMINLCKFGSIDGEKVEVIVRPSTKDSREREFSVGIKGGLNRERFSFIFSDGERFDKEVLPVILKEFLDGDAISSWTLVDSNQDEELVKSLIETSNENDFIIQTEDVDLLRELRDKVELSQPTLDDLQMSNDDQYCEAILKYLKRRSETRDVFDKINLKDRQIAVELIEGAIRERKSSNERLVRYLEKNKNDENKEVCDLLINDIVSSKSFVTDQIKKYIRNEHEYSNFFSDENFMKLLEVGKDLVRAGYFDAKYSFPNGAINFSEEDLNNFSNSRANTKYRVLSYVKDSYLKENKQEQALLVDKFISYLVKKRKLATPKVDGELSISDVDITSLESINEIVSNDFDELVRIYKLCKGKKLENEKVVVMVREDTDNKDKVIVSVDLSSKAAFDRYEFSFDDKAKFVREMLPDLAGLVKENDNVIDVKSYDGNRDLKINLTTMQSGDEFLVSLSPVMNNNLNTGDREKDEFIPEELTTEDLGLASYLRKKVLRDKGMLPPIGLREIEGLTLINPKVKELEDKWKMVLDGTASKEEYDALYDKRINELANVMGSKEKVLAFEYEDFPKITDDERQILLEGKDKLHVLEEDIRNYTREKEMKETPSPVMNPRFEDLHKLVVKYKAQNVGGVIKLYDRETGSEVIEPSKSLMEDVEFASYWTAALGVKTSKGDVVIGEKAAFSPEALELFNIVDVQFSESVKRNIPIDLDSLYKAFINTKQSEKGGEIFARLFKNQDYFKYVRNYYYNLSKREYISGTNIVKPRNREIYESDEEYTKLLQNYYEREFARRDYEIKQDINPEEKVEITQTNDLVTDASATIKPETVDVTSFEKEGAETLEKGKNGDLTVDGTSEKQTREEPTPPVMSNIPSRKMEIDKLKSVYKRASEISRDGDPTSIIVKFSDDNQEFNVLISCKVGDGDATLYNTRFYSVNAPWVLDAICNMYVSENGVVYNGDYVDNPDTNKVGSITLGKNHNCLKIENAPVEVVRYTEEKLREALNSEISDKLNLVKKSK